MLHWRNLHLLTALLLVMGLLISGCAPKLPPEAPWEKDARALLEQADGLFAKRQYGQTEKTVSAFFTRYPKSRHADRGLHLWLDLGAWWKDETGLPLPLGGNAVRRDLGPEMMARLTRLVRETVRHSLAHRPQALEYAMSFARGMDPGVADRFVGMWVNDMTVEMGERGRRAVQAFLDRGFEEGLIPGRAALDFVEA